MGLDLNRYRRKKEETATSEGSGGDFWIPKEGKNIIRLYSFRHVICDDDFNLRRYMDNEVQVGDGVEDIDVDCWVHFINKVPVNCSGRDCQVCLDARSSDDQMKKARHRYYVNAVVSMTGGTKEKELKMSIAALSKTAYDQILGYITDDDYGTEVLGDRGRDFVIEYNKEAQPANMYQVRIQDKEKCSDFKDLELEVTDLLSLQALMPNGYIKQAKETKKSDPAPKKKVQQQETTDDDARKAPPASNKKPAVQEETRPSCRPPAAEPADDDTDFIEGETLCFECSDYGKVEGEFVGTEPDKKKPEVLWYIIRDSKGLEYMAKKEEIFRPEKKSDDKNNRKVPRRA